MNKVEAPTIVYIAGYGRSGSTVLDLLLGSHLNFTSCGELTYLFEEWMNQSRVCSCGNQYSNCEFWGGLEEELPFSILTCSRIIRAVESRKSILDVLRSSPRDLNHSDFEKDAYTKIIDSLYGFVAAKGTGFVVDSSKSAKDSFWRAFSLKEFSGKKIKMIHLKRSLYQTLRSIKKTSNWQAEGVNVDRSFKLLRGVVGWSLANLNASRSKKNLGRDNYLKINYEDFIANPLWYIAVIEDFLEEDLDSLSRRVSEEVAFFSGHNVGGNRVRFSKSIILRR